MIQNLVNADNYNTASFGGCDIIPYIQFNQNLPICIGSISDLMVSTSRQAFEVLRMGTATPADFTQGARVVAGKIIFNSFDCELVQQISSAVYAKYHSTPLTSAIAQNIQLAEQMQSYYLQEKQKYNSSFNYDLKEVEESLIHMFEDNPDDLPLFDIALMAKNNQTVGSHSLVYGVRIMDSNRSYGISAVQSFVEYTFVARAYKPLTRSLISSEQIRNTV